MKRDKKERKKERKKEIGEYNDKEEWVTQNN